MRNEKTNPELKPFVKWAGGKGKLVKDIESILLSAKEKPFKKYAEPMVGGGALFFDVLSKYHFEQYYISDVNPELINAYTAIKENVEPLITRLEEMQAAFLPLGGSGRKQYFYQIRDRFNATVLSQETSVEKAACFIFLNKTCFNGLYRVNRKGLFNVPMGDYKNPAICDAENLRNIHSALQNVTIVCGDYTMAKAFIDSRTFAYFDPPYRPLSETSAFTSYTSDAFDDGQQIRLAQFIDEINATGAKIVLSNSDPKNVNPDDNFFDDLYKDYTIHRISAMRSINSAASKRGKIYELLIHN